jgi:DNA-binding NtrC family response regulator
MSTLARALIVDVDETVRLRLFRALLERQVFSDTTGHAPGALDCLDGRDYGLVILDLRLEDLIDVLAAVGRIARDRRPMVIGLGERDVAHELDDDLIQIVIRKPIALGQFADVVRRCLDSAPRWRKSSQLSATDGVPGAL